MKYDILLQGFHWESQDVRHQGKNWYQIIQENTQKIKDSGFTLMWFPPPSNSADYEGYLPRELNVLDTHYGSADDLRNAIAGLNPEVKSIADIVINHRVGSEHLHDFENPKWSTYTIVSDDEYEGHKSFHWDSGIPYHAGRDLDHRNGEVSIGLTNWMNDLKNLAIAGFAGWRYDYVKGYAGWATELYNKNTSPEFSVGEFFDYDVQALVNWIDTTHPEPAFRSTAFDFPLRNALYQAIVWKDFHFLKYADRAAGLIGLWSDKAVTFLENHDTEDVRNSQYAPWFPTGDQMLQGYAYLLTHPGIPCVFWKDIYDTDTELRSSGNYFQSSLDDLIWIRKRYGIHSESKLYIATAEEGNVYGAYIQGDNGELAMKIGPGPWQPWGDKWNNPVDQLLRSGSDFAVWGDRGRFW